MGFNNPLIYSVQRRVHEWAETVFGSATKVAPLWKRVLDEVQELMDEMDFVTTWTVKGVQDNPIAMRKIKSECADIVITLLRFAGALGFDLMEEVDKKQSINEGRNWESHGDGTGKHIKDEGI